MVSGYFCGSTSASASASGVTQPAQIFTRGKTAASRTSGRRPTRASRQAAVLPPGPPPTTMTSYRTTSASPERDEKPHPLNERHADLFDRVGDAHGLEEIALQVDGAVDVSLGEVERRRVADEPDEGLGLVHDGRTHRRSAAELDDRSVPQAEREAARDAVEDPMQDFRGAPRTRVLGKDHVCTVGGSRALIPGCAQCKNTSKARG